MSLHFEWDPEKARINRRKHRVPFEEASTVFGDPHSVTIRDSLHTNGEDRFITIGLSFRLRTIVVVHAERGDKIRVISARLASSQERKTYEEDK